MCGRFQSMEATENEFPFVASLPKRKQVKIFSLWDEAKEIAQRNIVPQHIAARLLNVSTQRIGQFIDRGQLPFVTWHGHDFIPFEDLLAFSKLHRPRGRPRLVDGVKAVVGGWRAHCKDRIAEGMKE